MHQPEIIIYPVSQSRSAVAIDPVRSRGRAAASVSGHGANVSPAIVTSLYSLNP